MSCYFQGWGELRPWQTRTHCWRHIVANTNVSPFAHACNICCGHKLCVWDTKNVSDFVQKHFVSATNVSQFAQPKKPHGQQCVRKIVSLFTGALKFRNYLVLGGGGTTRPYHHKANCLSLTESRKQQ